jgi:hypothetical protein
MGYSSHTYPRELAEKIISEWPEVTNPLDDLPPQETLVSLLSEAFQAGPGPVVVLANSSSP